MKQAYKCLQTVTGSVKIRLASFSNRFNFQSVQSTIQFKLWRLLAGFIFYRLNTVHCTVGSKNLAQTVFLFPSLGFSKKRIQKNRLCDPKVHCTLVLSDSNHLSLLASRREKGGGTFNPISGGVENIHQVVGGVRNPPPSKHPKSL